MSVTIITAIESLPTLHLHFKLDSSECHHDKTGPVSALNRQTISFIDKAVKIIV